MPITRILVVDNFLPWQSFVLAKLESETDLRIISIASDGLEAIQKAAELQPDVILIDIGLRGVNGFEATRQIRILAPASKIIFWSEHRSSDLIQAAFKAGAHGFVVKSDSDSGLISGIRAVLLDQQFVSFSLRGWRDFFSEKEQP